jgi:AraC-like DNA-binding protein
MLKTHIRGGGEPAGLVALSAESLFENRRSYRTNDVAHARADIERVFFRHSLARAPGEDGLQFCHRGARLWRTSFNYICYGSDVQVAVDYVDRDLFVAVIPLSGQAEVDYLGHRTPITRGQYVVLDPMAAFRFRMSTDHCHLAIGVPATLFRESTGAAQATRSGGLHAWTSGPRTLDDSDCGLIDYIAYLCQQLDRPATHLGAPAIARSVETSFLAMLFASLQRESAGSARGTDETSPATVVAHVKRAEAFILSNLTEHIRLDDIVAAAGVPTRTLYNGFQRFRGIGPIQWLRIQRLERARLDLAEPCDPALTVTDVANRYGASNFGRFARAYLELFGELPSETLRRGRSLKV